MYEAEAAGGVVGAARLGALHRRMGDDAAIDQPHELDDRLRHRAIAGQPHADGPTGHAEHPCEVLGADFVGGEMRRKFNRGHAS